MRKNWGIIPAAGNGTRIQPLAFSKELLPVGSSLDGIAERPRAVSEYVMDRMRIAGATNVCIVVSPGKSDIIKYFGNNFENIPICYIIQQNPSGICDAIFKAIPLINDDDTVMVGLPDTVWFPEDGFSRLKDNLFSFLLFPVDKPEFYDAVQVDTSGNVCRIIVKQAGVEEKWIWGAFKMPGYVYKSLFSLWEKKEQKIEYFGTLVNEYLQEGGHAVGIAEGLTYVDVGTINGYREALQVLIQREKRNLAFTSVVLQNKYDEE
jgi:dTDP-glucose pyrophosphorylase